jgi:DNA polymerase I
MEPGVIEWSEEALAGLWDPKQLASFDIETNLAHDKVWMVGAKGPVGPAFSLTEPIQCVPSLQAVVTDGATFICGHNSIAFDAPVLAGVWGIDVCKAFILLDTMVLARLLDPQRLSYRLKDLAKDYLGTGDQKGEFSNFDGGYSQDMEDYCLQDVEVTHKLAIVLLRELKRQGFSAESIWLEHEVARIIDKQAKHGFMLNVPAASLLSNTLLDEKATLKTKMETEFDPTVVVMKTKTKYIPFDPGSRKQCVDRLMKLGWVPTKYTKPTAMYPFGQPKIDDDVLASVAGMGHPVAVEIARYYKLQKISAMVSSWLEYADEGSRIHGRVNTNGAVTGRMTHSSPNLGQIPKRDLEFGPQCRALFTVPKGYSLVGADASGLELRLFAHYIQDPEYAEVLVSGDIHEFNRIAAGLSTRDEAKTFIYALLYGAGDRKIGSIVLPFGTDEEQARAGKKLKDKFFRTLPGLDKLGLKIDKILQARKAKGLPSSLPGLDGRQITVRHKHAAVNSLLQGGGAIVMKLALVLLDRSITQEGLDAHFVANVHDEFQIEVRDDHVDRVKELALASIVKAGEVLKLRCPLAGEAKSGSNWHDTH